MNSLPMVCLLIGMLSTPSFAQQKVTRTLKGHRKYVYSIAISPNGKTLASASDDKSIKLWNLSTGACTDTLHGHTDAVLCVTFGPDGKTLASGSADNTIRLWQVNTGKNTAILRGHTEMVPCVVFSPMARCSHR